MLFVFIGLIKISDKKNYAIDWVNIFAQLNKNLN